MTYTPHILLDAHGHPLIVYAKGRTKYHAVMANGSLRIVALDTLRGYVPALRGDAPYPVRRAASYYLNHSTQPITARAKAVLRSLVRRTP